MNQIVQMNTDERSSDVPLSAEAQDVIDLIEEVTKRISSLSASDIYVVGQHLREANTKIRHYLQVTHSTSHR